MVEPRSSRYSTSPLSLLDDNNWISQYSNFGKLSYKKLQSFTTRVFFSQSSQNCCLGIILAAWKICTRELKRGNRWTVLNTV